MIESINKDDEYVWYDGNSACYIVKLSEDTSIDDLNENRQILIFLKKYIPSGECKHMYKLNACIYIRLGSLYTVSTIEMGYVNDCFEEFYDYEYEYISATPEGQLLLFC